jgi:hypothetical protein
LLTAKESLLVVIAFQEKGQTIPLGKSKVLIAGLYDKISPQGYELP